MKQNQRGFSVVELAVAFLIGAVLVLIGVILFNRAEAPVYESSKSQKVKLYQNNTFGFGLSYPDRWGTLVQEKSDESSSSDAPIMLQTPKVDYAIGNSELTTPLTIMVSDIDNERGSTVPLTDHTSASGVPVKSAIQKYEGAIFQTLFFDTKNYQIVVTIPILSNEGGEISSKDREAYDEIVAKFISNIVVY